MEPYILQTNHLCKNFKGQHAVSDILDNKKFCLWFAWANGAGKSTTLKMITGMLRPTSGEIILEGHPWSRNDLSVLGGLPVK